MLCLGIHCTYLKIHFYLSLSKTNSNRHTNKADLDSVHERKTDNDGNANGNRYHSEMSGVIQRDSVRSVTVYLNVIPGLTEE